MTAMGIWAPVFFVILDEWSIPEPRECPQSIPRTQILVFVKTEYPAKIRPVVIVTLAMLLRLINCRFIIIIIINRLTVSDINLGLAITIPL